MLLSSFALAVLAVLGTGTLRPALSDSIVALPCNRAAADATARHDPVHLTVCHDDTHLRVVISRDLLNSDFMLQAAGSSGSLQPQARVVSNNKVLRLQSGRDSLVLLEFTTTVNDTFQYKRRDALVIRGTTPGHAFLVDAAAFGVTTGRELNIRRLPAQPMRPRRFDPRVLFLSNRIVPAYFDPSSDQFSAIVPGQYIQRWRLEKKDPTAAVSDVLHPIVFRLPANLPAPWVPYITHAILAWNPVLEAAGFRHAIVVKDVADGPVREHDVRMHWDATTHDGVAGRADPVIDPRTGEILTVDFTLYPRGMGDGTGAVLRGEVDPRTPLPLPDSSLMASFEDVVLHEMGHALGLDHNFKGAGVYPTDSLRSPNFVRQMGTMASVMAYAWGDYVAQPGDGITSQDVLRKIGPYDRWAIAWGYRPIPGARTSEEERATLEQWRQVQDTDPYLQVSLDHPGYDPTDTQELLGNDPVKSGMYALRNVTRVAAVHDPNQDSNGMSHPSTTVIADAWHDALQLAAYVVGGVVPQRPYPANVAKIVVVPIDSAQQLRAMQFVLAHAFYGQDDLIAKYVLANGLPVGSKPLVLFDSVALGWEKTQWQGFQVSLLNGLVERLDELRGTTAAGAPSAEMRVALCRELEGLRTSLDSAHSTASNAIHLQTLRSTLDKAFTLHGRCS